MTPKAMAARSPMLLRSVMPVTPRTSGSIARHWRAAISSLVFLTAFGCRDATAPARQFAVLSDDGQSDWQTVTVGGSHTCALKTNGNAYCWGDNSAGQLGVAASDTVCGAGKATFGCNTVPTQVQPGLQFASLSAGARHTCGITLARDAYCWGANDRGQVSPAVLTGPTLVQVAGSLGWADISAGFSHTCAVRTDGALFCWGADERGQLGNGRTANSISAVQVPLPEAAASVSAGQQRTCARGISGTVYCWGAVWTAHQSGTDLTRSQLTPQAVPSAPPMAWLSVGTSTTCGAGVSGVAYCWEANPHGEMGTGSDSGSTTPKAVAGGLGFVQVSAGVVHTCGVATSGAGYCWGDDSFGQLGAAPAGLLEKCGNQPATCSTIPVAIFGRQQFTTISAGFGDHACGVTVRGNLYCWGLGTSGQRGDGTETFAIFIPIMIAEPRTL
jgi:alpha-tubulin suppressor-like RCC1 family protein